MSHRYRGPHAAANVIIGSFALFGPRWPSPNQGLPRFRCSTWIICHDFQVAGVRIGAQGGDGWLGFDLGEVLAAVGEWEHLDWVLRDANFLCDVTNVWSEGVGVEEQTFRPGGLPITAAEMRTLAATCHQIIDGRFTGYLPDGSPLLSLAVIDSSFWLVWTEDSGVLDRVRATFVNVTDIDELNPEGR